MRIIQTLLLAVTPLVALAAKDASQSKFDEYHSRSLSSTPLKLDDASYDDLTVTPRDYTVVVLLTALEARFGCQLCRDFQPEWDLIGRSWVKGDRRGENRVLYGTLDFTDGKGTFQKLMLQTAPILMLFPPTVDTGAKGDGQPIRYDFSMGPRSAEQVYAWITRQLPDGPKPSIHRPLNYVRIVAVTTTILGLITFFSVASPYILPVIQNRNLWAAISLITILLFTSGHMFNHIRKVPYISGNGKGGITYFAGGFSNQFGLETQIVAAMYGVLSFATIALALKVPRMSDPKQQQVAVFVWGGVIFGMYSFLLSVFRIKNGGYPFYLPPF
ncbi:oligosaccharyl transferase subunit ost3/OST6 [Toensbergia leucococca]|nr:oligosaccharyl transferase subunit ost3/OST6 [Toensbergia leucococca]